MKKNFKEFVISWYYFLKQEKWVVKAFVIIVLAFGFIFHTVSEAWIYVRNDVGEYTSIKLHSASFEIIAKKLHDRFMEAHNADQNVT